MKTRKIGPFEVSEISLGCMNLSHAYGVPPSAEQGARVLLAALDAGVTMFDTAALYGFGANETLVGNVLKPHRRRFTLASKGGMAGVAGADGVVRRVIDGWDAQDAADRVEARVGRDLQFIRINGTVVGGLVGALLHITSITF